jgi:hypothetical protein
MGFLTVALAGQLGSGKSALAEYLDRRLNFLTGESWVQNGFAIPVKQIFCEAFGVDNAFIERWKRIDEPPPGFDLPVRQCLILIGDGFRQMKSRVWIEHAFRNQTAHQVIFDCRYLNEATTVRELGGVSVLLWRPGHENDLPNASEQQLVPLVRELAAARVDGPVGDPNVPFDLFLVNDGSLTDLHAKVDRLVVPFVLARLGR